MAGRLYVVGVGPGDPELLTLKGARILGEVGCICVPKGREEGSSLALSIAREAVDLRGKEIVEIHFPMVRTKGALPGEELDSRWAEAVAAIRSRVDKGIDTAFITIGDPGIYSTFFYVFEKLLAESPGLQIEVVPGISSINGAAARAGMPLALGDESIAVLPANYLSDLDSVLDRFTTVVLMKVYKVFDELVEKLSRLNLLNDAIYIARAGMSDERICTDLNTMKRTDLDYFSLVIVRRQRRR